MANVWSPADVTTEERWQALWTRLGGRESMERWHEVLVACYSAPERHYHTLEHIASCLVLLDELRSLAGRPDEVELALWTHDVIWEPLGTESELLSAGWMRQVGIVAGVNESILRRVADLIMATTHAHQAKGGDAALIQDLDLAILGADQERFDAYDAAIAAEYSTVPAAAFRAGRAQVLHQFLHRPAIYQTTACQTRFESYARANLARALGRL